MGLTYESEKTQMTVLVFFKKKKWGKKIIDEETNYTSKTKLVRDAQILAREERSLHADG